MHLKLDYIGSYEAGNNKHAQDTMKELGISYQYCTPQSMADSFWFWNCENIPAELPSYIEELSIDPMSCIGWGLTQSAAEAIALKSSTTKA